MYTSPSITRRPDDHNAKIMIYPVKISSPDEAPMDGIGVTLKDPSDDIFDHVSIAINGENVNGPISELISWLTARNFTIEVDTTLIEVIGEFGQLAQKLRDGEISMEDYCVPPTLTDFDSDQLPALSRQPHRAAAVQ